MTHKHTFLYFKIKMPPHAPNTPPPKKKKMVSKFDSFSSVKSVPPKKKKVLKFPNLTTTLDSLTGQGRSPGCLGQGDEPPQPTTLEFGRFLFEIQNTMTMTQKHFSDSFRILTWFWDVFLQ